MSDHGGAVEVVTFGCRLNAYESEVMRALAGEAGRGDTVIVNTCAVTAEAERQARQAIRRLRRERPAATIIVTGCAAQITPERFAEMPEVDRVLGNAEKLDRRSYGDKDSGRIIVADVMSLRETAAHLVADFADRARAFVEVQQGCDHRCTFCIIPYGRGPSRSVPIGQVVEATRRLVERGYQEAVLTGVDLTAYGGDLPERPSLGQLVRRLLAAVPDLPRLRLSSIDPAEVDDELFRLIGEEPRLMPHLHLSLQAGDDLILKRMRRRHSRADAVTFCERVRRARTDIVLGADLIAGFPTESEAMFARTLGLIEDCGLSLLHVFAFSPRPGTPAAKMPQVPAAERKARAARLRAAGQSALSRELRSHIGRQTDVLVENGQTGRTEHYLPVQFDHATEPGRIVAARVVGADDKRLLGHVLD